MAEITPISYNPSKTPLAGTTQVGDLLVGTSAKDYGSTPPPGNLKWWATPDTTLGYVVARAMTGTNQPNPLGTTGGVAFWRSAAKTEESFIELYEYLAPQLGLTAGVSGGTGAGTTASAYLTAAGYWNSWVNTWQYNNSTFLSWPDYGTTGGFTQYTGGFNGSDDGNALLPIVTPYTFEMNNQGETTNLYVSTNGYITFGQGAGNIISTPQSQANPAAIAGNPSDQWLQPGLAMTDGDVQDVYYKSIDMGGGKWGMQLKVYQGTYGASTTPKSYILNIYRDSQFQWVEARAKLNVSGNAGPYNTVDVSQASSTISKVWRGDLNGQNWVYMGTGSVQP